MIASTGQFSAAARIFSLASVSGSVGWDWRAVSRWKASWAVWTHWAEPMHRERSTSTCQRSPSPQPSQPAGRWIILCSRYSP
ncbi:hypothetical protein SVIOM74S_00909 [Streptomyces violarus]